jgi:hypothetical protein
VALGNCDFLFELKERRFNLRHLTMLPFLKNFIWTLGHDTQEINIFTKGRRSDKHEKKSKHILLVCQARSALRSS